MTRRIEFDGTFKNSLAKVSRAKKVLDEFKIEAAKLASSTNTTIVKQKTETGVAFEFQNTEKLDVADLSAIAGDVIHNLRSSLDQMASELARLNENDDSNVYFPFSKSETDFELMIKKRKFHLAGKEATELVKTLKPFKGGNTLLRCLHDFDLEDKHRNLVSLSQQVATPSLRLGPDAEPVGTVFQVKVSFNCPFSSPLSGVLILKALEDMVQMTEGIIKAFSMIRIP